jgi:hypothetical protein
MTVQPCPIRESLLAAETESRLLAMNGPQDESIRAVYANVSLAKQRERYEHQNACPICISKGLAEPMHPGEERGE